MNQRLVRAFLGLGSNLGDRLGHLQEAVDRISALDGLRVIRASRVYETAPIGPPQPDYLNAVLEVETSLRPWPLLEACLGIEAVMGRVRGERWGPRVVDIDLLTYGRERIDDPGLTVPHPRMHERAFVLVPLLELESDPPLPEERRIEALALGDWGLQEVRSFAPPPLAPGPPVPRARDRRASRTRADASRD